MRRPPSTDATIRLRDGRVLAYCEWGTAGGPVVLAFHGSPGSRLWWPDENATKAAGVRLVTVDRPGYGGSDPKPGRPIREWGSDVAELAQGLGVDRFGVVGWSGGAPYAAAVAATLPDRLTGVCLASSASLTYILESTEREADDLRNIDAIERRGTVAATLEYAEEIRAWAAGVLQDPAGFVMDDGVSDGDRWLLDDPVLAADLFDSIREALRQGAIGAATDWVALVAPWGFSLDDIHIPVHLWHGRQDPIVDLSDVENVVAGLPNGSLTVWPDVGHFGPAKYWSDILAAALG